MSFFVRPPPSPRPAGVLSNVWSCALSFGGEIGGGQILMILTCAAGVRPCKNMTNVNAKPSLISQTAMTQAKSWVLWTNWNDFQLKLWCQRPGILSVQRARGWVGGRLVISCFLIPRTRGRCPCWWPDTDTHCHRGSFCVERRKNSLTAVLRCR